MTITDPPTLSPPLPNINEKKAKRKSGSFDAERVEGETIQSRKRFSRLSSSQNKAVT